MIEYIRGDILESQAEAIVNPVNCVGVMGRGLALQFKNAYPGNFKAYAAACKSQRVQPGRMFVFEIASLVNPRLIINFPTKRHWREPSRMEDIESGLRALVEVIRDQHLKSVAVPALGAGLGGLDWAEVKQRIHSALGPLSDTRISVYEPEPDENEDCEGESFRGQRGKVLAKAGCQARKLSAGTFPPCPRRES